MSLKYIIAILLTFIGISCAILGIVFLASAALYGSLVLTSICLIAMILYFVGVRKLNQDNDA